MKETSTHNHLLQSIYNELDTCEDYKLKNEILTNATLAEEFRELKKSVSLLNSAELSPKTSTVEAILRKSKRTEKEMA